jgi:hypothetical protein
MVRGRDVGLGFLERPVNGCRRAQRRRDPSVRVGEDYACKATWKPVSARDLDNQAGGPINRKKLDGGERGTNSNRHADPER